MADELKPLEQSIGFDTKALFASFNEIIQAVKSVDTGIKQAFQGANQTIGQTIVSAIRAAKEMENQAKHAADEMMKMAREAAAEKRALIAKELAAERAKNDALAASTRGSAFASADAVKNAAKDKEKAELQWAKAAAQAQKELTREQEKADQERTRTHTQWAKMAIQAEKEIARETKQAWDQIKSGVQATTVAAGVALAGLSAVVISSAKEYAGFEATLIRFKATSGATTEEMDNLKAASERLGKETIYSNSQVANAAQVLKDLGFSASEAVKSLDGVVQVAIITGKTLEESAKTMGVALHSLGMGADQAGHIADVFAVAKQKGADVSAMAESMHYLGSKIANVSHSSEDLTRNFNTMAGMMTIANKAGIAGGQFGQDMAQAMTHLLAPTKKGVDEMLHLGLATKDANGKLKTFAIDANGHMKPMTEIVRVLKETSKNMGDMEKATMLKKIFGVDALTALNPILNTTQKELDKIDNQFQNTNGASKKLTEGLKHGLAYSFNLLEGSIETAKSSLGQSFAPVMVKIIGLLQGLFDGFTNLSQPIKDLVADLVLGAIGVTGLTFAIGGTALAINAATLAVSNLGKGLTYLSGQNIAATGTTTALTGANTLLAGSFRLVGGSATATATAIGGIVIAVGAAVTALLYMIDQTNKALDMIEQAEGQRAAIDARTMGTMARIQRQGGAQNATEANDAATEARNRINRVNDEKVKVNAKIIEQQAYLEQQKKTGNSSLVLYATQELNKSLQKQTNLKKETDLLDQQVKGYNVLGQSLKKIEDSKAKEKAPVIPPPFTPTEKAAPGSKAAEKKAETEADRRVAVEIKQAETKSKAEIEAYKKSGEAQQKTLSITKAAHEYMNSGQAEAARKKNTGGFYSDAVACAFSTKEIIKNIGATKELLAVMNNNAPETYQGLVKGGFARPVSSLKGKEGFAFGSVGGGAAGIRHVGLKLEDDKVFNTQGSRSTGGAFPKILPAENSGFSSYAQTLYLELTEKGKKNLKGMVTQISDQVAKDTLVLQDLEGVKAKNAAYYADPENADKAAALDKKIANLKLKIGKETQAEQDSMAKQARDAEAKARKDLIKMDIDIAKQKIKLGKESLDATIADIDKESELNTIKNKEQMTQALAVEGLSQATKNKLIEKYQELEATEQAAFLKQKEEAIYEHDQKLKGLQDQLHQYELDLMAESTDKIIAESQFRLKKQIESLKDEQHNLLEGSDIWKAIEEEKTAVTVAELRARDKAMIEFRLQEAQAQAVRAEKNLGKTSSGQGLMGAINSDDFNNAINEGLDSTEAQVKSLTEYSRAQEQVMSALNLKLTDATLSKEQQKEINEQILDIENKIFEAESLIVDLQDPVIKSKMDQDKIMAGMLVKMKDAGSDAQTLATKMLEFGAATGMTAEQLKEMANTLATAIPLSLAIGQGLVDIVTMIPGIPEGFKSALSEAQNIVGSFVNAASKGFADMGANVGAVVSVLKGIFHTFVPDIGKIMDKNKELFTEIMELDQAIASKRMENMKAGLSPEEYVRQAAEMEKKAGQARLDVLVQNANKELNETDKLNHPAIVEKFSRARIQNDMETQAKIDAIRAEGVQTYLANSQAMIDIDKNLASQRLALMGTESEKRKAERQKELDDNMRIAGEAAKAGGIGSGDSVQAKLREMNALTNSKYDRLELEAKEKQLKELQALENQFENQQIGLMQDGLAKSLAQISQATKQKKQALQEQMKELFKAMGPMASMMGGGFGGTKEQQDQMKTLQAIGRGIDDEDKKAKEDATRKHNQEQRAIAREHQKNLLDLQSEGLASSLAKIQQETEANHDALWQRFEDGKITAGQLFDLQSDEYNKSLKLREKATDDYNKMVAEKARNAAKQEAQNSGDLQQIIRTNHSATLQQINEFEKAGLKQYANDAQMKAQITRQANADRLKAEFDLHDQLKNLYTDRYNLYKNIMQDELKVDTSHYTDEIKRLENSLKPLKDSKALLEEQLKALDDELKKRLKDFGKQDFSQWQGMLAGASVSDETLRKALMQGGANVNADMIPTSNAAAETQQAAMEKYFNDEKTKLDALKVAEEITPEEYDKQFGDLILLRGKFYDNLRKMTGLNHDKELKYLVEYSEAYKDYQDLQIRMMTEKANLEKDTIQESIDANQAQQDSIAKGIAANQAHVDEIAQQYNEKMSMIDNAIGKVNTDHLQWQKSLYGLDGTVSEVLTRINSQYEATRATMSQPLSIGAMSGQPQAGSGTTSGGATTPRNTTRYVPTVSEQTAQFSIKGNDGWYMSYTDRYDAEGFATGGVVPDGYPDDTYRTKQKSKERVLTPEQNANFEKMVEHMDWQRYYTSDQSSISNTNNSRSINLGGVHIAMPGMIVREEADIGRITHEMTDSIMERVSDKLAGSIGSQFAPNF